MISKEKPFEHIPLRTCIACRALHPKSHFLRIVRTPEGEVEFDPEGKKQGRGAYVCRKPECWERAFRREGELISRALKVPLPPARREEIFAEGKRLLERMRGER